MRANRSMPSSTVIPVLGYPDMAQAVAWLCDVFEFTERLRIGTHRAQLNVGDGHVVVAAQRPGEAADAPEGNEPGAARRSHIGHSVMVRIEDVNRHYERAKARGARILQPPTGFPYGERQYTVEDLGGHRWTFSQTISDTAPEAWGGTPIRPSPEPSDLVR